jgi:Mg2+/Co2+ transporter CorB
VGGVSDDEYADLIEIAHQQGTVGDGEREILLHLLALDRRSARDAMRPRARTVMLPDEMPIGEMVAAARRSGHHWIPLYDETPDNVVGVLNTRTLLLSPEPDLFLAMEFPSFVPESMNLLTLFESMQRQRRGVAIVLDEYGSTAGLITLQDILATVVGEIRREGEPQRGVRVTLRERLCIQHLRSPSVHPADHWTWGAIGPRHRPGQWGERWGLRQGRKVHVLRNIFIVVEATCLQSRLDRLQISVTTP